MFDFKKKLINVLSIIDVFLLIFYFLLNYHESISEFLDNWFFLFLFFIFVIVLFSVYLHKNHKINKCLNSIVSFLLAFLILLSSFVLIEIYPFGDKIFSTVDLYSQYTPFLENFKNLLANHGSFSYSFELGLGMNYVPLFGYYLASPFNFLLLLFPSKYLAEAIGLIIIIKLSLCSATMTYYFQEKYKNDLLCILFGIIYASTSYMIAYSWNIMWLDCFYLFPLIMLGLDKLLYDNKPFLYVICLFLSIYCNYYISFMICIYICIYFFLTMLTDNRITIKILFKFMLFSLLAGGMAMFVVLPTYLGLGVTSAVNDTVSTVKLNFEWIKFFEMLFVNSDLTIRSGGLPNVMCGSLVVLLTITFIFNKKILLNKRLKWIGLLVLLYLSMYINVFNFIWHGMHTPNDLPYRFSFLFSFTLINIGYIQYINSNKKELVVSFGLSICIFLLGMYLNNLFGLNTIYTSIILILLYGIIMFFDYKILLCFVILIESLYINNNGFLLLKKQESMMSREYSYESENALLIHEAISKLKYQLKGTNYHDIYRTEVLPNYTLIGGSMFNYNGMSVFSSTNYYNLTKFMDSLGYKTNGINSYTYKSFIPTIDSLFGLKYFISNVNLNGHSQLSKIDSVSNEKYTYNIYQNKDALSLGYVVNNNIKNYKFTRYNPYVSHIDLYKALSNSNVKLYELSNISFASDKVKLSDGHHFYIESDGEKQTYEFNVNIDYNGPNYIYVDCRAADNISVSGVGEWSYKANSPYIIDNGNRSTDEFVNIRIETDSTCSGNIYVMTLNNYLYDEVINNLKLNEMQIVDFVDSEITAYVNCDFDGVLMTSIPYDKGWKVIVDGEFVETFDIADSLLGLEITEGYHDIKFIYKVPGMMVGILISFVSFMALIIIYFIVYKKQRIE